jgi:hypothetical protein
LAAGLAIVVAIQPEQCWFFSVGFIVIDADGAVNQFFGISFDREMAIIFGVLIEASHSGRRASRIRNGWRSPS